MPVEVPSQGPTNARVIVVGEAPGQHEVEQLQPFVGPSGMELTRMLREAGFERTQCFITNVCRIQPPRNEIKSFFGKRADKVLPFGEKPHQALVEGHARLSLEIQQINPDLILAFGDTALRATTGQTGITKWRGSVLPCNHPLPDPPKVLPTYHPAAVLRNYSWRQIVVNDLRRAKRELSTHGRKVVIPPYSFIVRPTYGKVMWELARLQELVDRGPLSLACDIETQRRHIDCIGLAWSPLEAICIPIIKMDGGARFYWDLEQQTEIVLALRSLLTHPNARVIGQNFPYDSQYIAREWGFIPHLTHDTMTVHHSIFCTLPKSLDFQSSLYCDFHRYWKKDAKDAEGYRLGDEDQWVYNARDCVVTFECAQKQLALIEQMKFPSVGGLTPQQRQMSLHLPILKAMLRGVKVPLKRKHALLESVDRAIKDREKYLQDVVGHPLNPRSPKQLQAFFYNDMKVRIITKRKTGNATTDEEALNTIAKREPLLSPICEMINDIRSLGTYKAVCNVPLDHDGRLRCSYSIPGTETFRFSSSSDAFDYGTNLQNITSGTEGGEDLDHASLDHATYLRKPNLRTLLVPDEGYTIAEFDLPQADARVVAWEANDKKLKAVFKDPSRDLHTENAKDIFGACLGKEDPRRQYAKAGVHAANYGVQARTLAIALGITILQAEQFLVKWFNAHPGIKEWQDRLGRDSVNKRYVENVFGYRRYCFGRPGDEFKEILAWQPQSTVAIITNTGLARVDSALCDKGVDLLLQTHDSATFQIWTKDGPALAKRIVELMTVEVPYPGDPLAMVPDAKFSEVSWGDCKRRPEWL